MGNDIIELPIAKIDSIAIIAGNITTGLAAFNKRKAEITAKVAESEKLIIIDHTDKAGFKILSDYRKQLKADRIQIENEGLFMRGPLTKLGKEIIEKENELTAIIQPAEKKLTEKEKWFNDENDRIKKEQAAIDADRIQNMADQLAALNFPFNIEQLKTVTPEQFQEALKYATDVFEKNEALKLTAAKAEADLKEAERVLLEIERAELERLRLQNETLQKQIKDQQDKIDAENTRQENERAAIEKAKQKVIDDAARAKELEDAKVKAAEDARLKLLADQKAAAEKKAETERKAAAAAERKARLAPDKTKLLELAARITALETTGIELKAEEAKSILAEARKDLSVAVNLLLSRSENL